MRHVYLAYLPPDASFTSELRRSLRRSHADISFDFEVLERSRQRLTTDVARSRAATALDAHARTLLELATEVADAMRRLDDAAREVDRAGSAAARRGLGRACRAALAVIGRTLAVPSSASVRRAVAAEQRRVRRLLGSLPEHYRGR